jgi:hypothetical protein
VKAMRRSVLLFGLLGFLMAGPPAAGKAFAADPYKMTFRGYSAEVLRGVEEYIVEFPLYAGHRLVEEGPQGVEYEYRSGAEASEIAASLSRMFLYLDVQGGIDVEERLITVTHPDYTEPPPEQSVLPEPVEETPLEPPPENPPGENTETQTALRTQPAPAPKPAPVPEPQPLTLRLTTARGDRPTFSIGENFDLTVKLNRDAWLYCYYRQVDGSVVKLFPNPQHGEAKLKGGVRHRIPGDIYPFDLAFSEPPGEETLICYASARDVGADLPSLLRMPDFGTLPVGMDARLHDIFAALKDTEIVHDSLSIVVTR